MNIFVDHKKHKKFVAFAIFLLLSLAFFASGAMHVFSLLPQVDYTIGLASSIRFGYMNLSKIVYVTQFVLACSAVRQRFKILNQHLEYPFLIGGLTTVSSKQMKSKEVGRLFHRLCDAIKLINSTFTFPFVVIFSNLMVRLIILFVYYSICIITNAELFFIAWEYFRCFRNRERDSSPNKVFLCLFHP